MSDAGASRIEEELAKAACHGELQLKTKTMFFMSSMQSRYVVLKDSTLIISKDKTVKSYFQ
eukprot:m.33726 g.33726  ORF g.33726 m.33726 type:complete len:61 (+) comp8591_c0_seq2:206-388(+)